MKTYRPSLEPLEPRELLAGFTPGQLRQVYGFTQAARQYGAAAQGQGVAIAIVDVWNNVNVYSDLAVFDRRNHLPPVDLTVVNLGNAGDSGAWNNASLESTMDIEAVHGLLPLARIYLVESAGFEVYNLAIAEQQASSLPGVVAVSNSWGAVDMQTAGYFPSAWFSTAFADQHVVYAAGASDVSGPMYYPADAQNVVGVGGTVLTHDRRGWHQRPWLSYTAGASNLAKVGPDVRMIGGPPGMLMYSVQMNIIAPFGWKWQEGYGTSLSTPAFCAVIGAVAGVRQARGEAPLGTAQVLAGLSPGEIPTVPGFITRFA
jgi:subtilase family serine protease